MTMSRQGAPIAVGNRAHVGKSLLSSNAHDDEGRTMAFRSQGARLLWRKTLPMVVLAAVLIMTTGAAEARQPLSRSARRLNRKAEALFVKGEYVQAQEYFTRAYAAQANATILFNVGLCQEKQARLLEALRTYRRLLDVHTEVSFKADVEARAAKVERRLRKTHARVELRTEPPGAAVYLDGSAAPAGTTPYVEWLPSGAHRVRLALDRYLPVQEALELQAGADTERGFTLVPEGAPGHLLLVDVGEGATLRLDGKELGTAPSQAPLELAAGPHSLELRRDGFVPFIGAAQVAPGAVVRVQVVWVSLPDSASTPGRPAAGAAPGPPPGPEAGAAASEPSPVTSRGFAPVGAWVLGGAAVVAAGTGLGLHIAAIQSASEARDLTEPGSDPVAWQTKSDEMTTRATRAYLSYGLAGAATAAAAILIVLHHRDGPGRPEPAADSSGATALWIAPLLSCPGVGIGGTF